MIDARIRAGVSLAFRKVQDLAKPSVFHKRTPQNFSFSAPAPDIVVDVPLKIVQIELKRNYKDRRQLIATFLFDASTLGELSAYDKFTYDGREWQLGTETKGNDFITMLSAFSEDAV